MVLIHQELQLAILAISFPNKATIHTQEILLHVTIVKIPSTGAMAVSIVHHVKLTCARVVVMEELNKELQLMLHLQLMVHLQLTEHLQHILQVVCPTNTNSNHLHIPQEPCPVNTNSNHQHTHQVSNNQVTNNLSIEIETSNAANG